MANTFLPKKLNNNTLKFIACLSMVVDHMTAGILLPIVRDGLYDGGLSGTELNTLYKVLRAVGRTAFPIFCFLLTEGFIHTKSKPRYALSLLIFGIISEPFFDLTLYATTDRYNPNIVSVLMQNRDLWFAHQNVYFTLLIGLIVIWIIDTIQSLYGPILPISSIYDPKLATAEGNLNPISFLLSAAVAASGAYLAQYIHSDYRWWGVLLIVILYLLKDFGALGLAAGYLFISNLSTEYWCFPAFILLLFYSKKRGKRLGRLKYCFYFFYPVHLLMIYYIRYIFFG